MSIDSRRLKVLENRLLYRWKWSDWDAHELRRGLRHHKRTGQIPDDLAEPVRAKTEHILACLAGAQGSGEKCRNRIPSAVRSATNGAMTVHAAIRSSRISTRGGRRIGDTPSPSVIGADCTGAGVRSQEELGVRGRGSGVKWLRGRRHAAHVDGLLPVRGATHVEPDGFHVVRDLLDLPVDVGRRDDAAGAVGAHCARQHERQGRPGRCDGFRVMMTHLFQKEGRCLLTQDTSHRHFPFDLRPTPPPSFPSTSVTPPYARRTSTCTRCTTGT